jgi:hypothetical protein
MMNGFSVALENCVIAYRDDFAIPDVKFPWDDGEPPIPRSATKQ